MKLSLNWLSDFVDIKVTPEEYAGAMTMSGSKVETVEYLGACMKNVVVGRAVAVEKHPNADRLFVCTIDVGAQEPLTIVTGAQNVTVGAMVPVALDGSLLPCGKEIKKGKLRGIMSEGMLCSGDELLLQDYPGADADGILILNEPCREGQDMRELLLMDDYVVDFEITNNRPDCLSVRGLARESAATLGRELRLPVPEPNDNGPGHDLKLRIEDTELCTRYSARVVQNVKIEPSPRWLRQRLKAAGIRAINNIVDVTNYVMLEYGQPMHAFDKACLEGGQIVVRRARAGESLQTLDGVMRPLAEHMLVIADGSRPVGVAGVMGGANSEITDKTHTVVLESACFNGPSVRKTALALNMRTDASSRFEKGLDAENTIPALDRACQLIAQLGAGEICRGLVDEDHSCHELRKLRLEPDKINALLGTDIGADFMEKALISLGFTVEGGCVTVPGWRSDIEGGHDLAEEVARLYGYNEIPSTLPRSAAPPQLNPSLIREGRVHELMRRLGYCEMLSYSFIGAQDYELAGMSEKAAESIKIRNPLGEERSLMRVSMLPGLIGTLARNARLRNENVLLYELSLVYLPDGEELPSEEKRVVFGGGGDFFETKGVVESLLALFRVKPGRVSFEPLTDEPCFHPGRAMRILIDGKAIGAAGQLHPSIERANGFSVPVCAAELSFDALCALEGAEARYKPLPRYPGLSRDIAVIVAKDVSAAALHRTIVSRGGNLLEECRLFDVYTGAQLSEGFKSLAFALSFRHTDRTLTDEEADNAVRKILAQLDREHGAKLR